MDRQLIEQKLESLRRCVARAGEKCPPEAPNCAAGQSPIGAQRPSRSR
jgi:hypothetical protein